ncbi:MAG: leucine-rich repeat domain-containing protein [Clostridiales bacterium]|nr:leucine-rich repeat domain-containing protein [Clostridiales bacterium]
MSKFLKAISVIISIVMVATVVACTQNKQDTTTNDTTETTEKTVITTSSEAVTTDKGTTVQTTESTKSDTTAKTTTEQTTKEQTTDVTSEETTSDEAVTTNEDTSTTHKDPVVYVGSYDPVSEKVGSYVKLEYNPMYCSVKSEVKKGLGSKETVTLTVTMNDGYIFDGWSTYDYICNATEKTQAEIKITKTETYSFDVNTETEVYANYSMKVVYNANGGKTSDGKSSLETTFCVSEFKCPSTLPDKGQFVREGYVLSEYNTKADGSGTAVSLGSKIRSDSSTLTLYCIWLKENPASDFDIFNNNGEVSIFKYKGSSKDVVVPEKINGMKVTAIEQGAFTGSLIETVFLPKTIRDVSDGAFSSCSNLNTLVFFDSIETMSDRAFSGCKKLTNVRINAVMDMYYVGWISATYCKTDRLIWAAEMQKFIIYGGSGTINGIDSTQINDAIGADYVVINMGANANASASFVFEGMQKWLIDGDIILWDPEPGNNTLGDNSLGARAIPFYVMGNYDFVKGIDITKHKNFFNYLLNGFAEKRNGSVSSWEMGNKTVNCYGDSTSKRETQGKQFQYRFDYLTSRYDYSRMTYIISELKKNGVDVWFSYAVMDESLNLNDWAHQGETIEEVAEQYTEAILEHFDVTIISDFFDCTVPNKYFYDSEWHLTNEGAVLRTQKLLVDILAQFKKIGKNY